MLFASTGMAIPRSGGSHVKLSGTLLVSPHGDYSSLVVGYLHGVGVRWG
jgi:hypothetical protein